MSLLTVFIFNLHENGECKVSRFQDSIGWTLFFSSGPITADRRASLLHVGFYEPDRSSVIRALQQHLGNKLVTEPAVWILSTTDPVSEPVACINIPNQSRDIPVRIFGHRKASDDLKFFDDVVDDVSSSGLALQNSADSRLPAANEERQTSGSTPSSYTDHVTAAAPTATALPGAEEKGAQSQRAQDPGVAPCSDTQADLNFAHSATSFRNPSTGDPLKTVLLELPSDFLNTSIAESDLTARMKNALVRNRIRVFGELLGNSYERILSLPQVGQKSMDELIEYLESAKRFHRPSSFTELAPASPNAGIAASPPKEILLSSSNCPDLPNHGSTAAQSEPPKKPSLNALLLSVKARCTEREFEIARLRLGLDGNPMTLQEIGDQLNITREGVRQVEAQFRAKALRLLAPLHQELKALWEEPSAELSLATLIEQHPFFVGFCELPTNSAENVLGKLIEWFTEFHHVETSGAHFFCTSNKLQLEDLVRDVRSKLYDIPACTLTQDQTVEFISQICAERELARLDHFVLNSLSDELNFAVDGSDLVLVSVGKSAEPTVTAVLQGAIAPLHYSDIAALCSQEYGREFEEKRAHMAAQEVGYLFGPGTYGLRKHLPVDEQTVFEICSTVEELMENSDDRERQWHCSELLDLLEDTNFTGLTEYTLNICLQLESSLIDLKRMVWTLDDGLAEEGRLAISQLCENILEEAGEPLSNSELIARLSEIRGMKQNACLQPKGRVVRFGRGVWGLIDRDIDLSSDERKALLDWLFRHLAYSSSGMHVDELSLLASEQPLLNRLEPGAVVALARCDERFRLNRTNHIELTEWSHSSGDSLACALEALLREASTTPLSHSSLLELASERLRRPLTKQSVSNSLQKIGARYDEQAHGWSLPIRQV